MTDADNAILAWHFLPEDGRIYGNGHLEDHKRTLVEEGQTITIDPPIVLCKRGLHASVKPLDALGYAPGPICCRVRVEGGYSMDEDSGERIYHPVRLGDDKVAGMKRTVLAMKDVSDLLHLFACDIAEEALQKYNDKPDERSLRAIKVKRLWVAGEATDDELDAAREAALNAAKAAVRYVGWDSARAAARYAVLNATNDTARYAALNATNDTVRAASWEADKVAAYDAASKHLEDRLLDALGEAAHD